MKKALCVLAILAMAITATASVRVFVTSSADPYGLTIPANHGRPTFSSVDAVGNNLNAKDYYYGTGPYVVNNFPPIAAPSGTVGTPVEIAQNKWAYIWFQFVDEPKNANVNGLKVEITGPGGFTPTYYVQNDKGGGPAKKRWDGTATPLLYPEWHNNPQTMVAVTAWGLVNSPSDAQMMQQKQAGVAPNPFTSVMLLGAVDLTVGGTYSIQITDISYATPPNPTVGEAGVFHYTPEPASLLLMALAGLVMRRR